MRIINSSSSWYLTKITSPQGEEVIFSYQNGGAPVQQRAPFSQWFNIRSSTAAVNDVAGDATTCAALYLDRITFPTGYLVFERDAQPREDLLGAERLKRIRLYRNPNASESAAVLLREFEFYTSYLVSPLGSGGTSSGTTTPSAYERKRLKLNQLTERAGTTTKSHTFSYNATPLPAKTSFSQDHWGYYNASDNLTLVPGYTGILPPSSRTLRQFHQVGGADRKANAAAMKAGTLERIHYPTGGKALLDLEPHEYSNALENSEVVQVTHNANAQVHTNGSSTTGDIKFTLPPSPEVVATLEISVSAHWRPLSGFPSFVYAEIDGGKRYYFENNDPFNNTGDGTYALIEKWPESTLAAGVEHTLRVVLPARNTLPSWSGELIEGGISVSYRHTVARERDEIGGGLRVRKLTFSDPVNPAQNLVTEYHYKLPSTLGGPEKSTGLLMSRPQYLRRVLHDEAVYLEPGNAASFSHWNRTEDILLESHTRVPLGTAQGSLVGYSAVTVFKGPDGANGKTVYTYHNRPDEFLDYPERPSGLPTSADALNGYLISQEDYVKENTAFRLAKQQFSAYDIANSGHVKNIAIGPNTYSLYGVAGYQFAAFHFYPTNYRWVRLTSTREVLYAQSDASSSLVTETHYEYNPGNRQVSKRSTQRSDGSTLVTYNKYPVDYTAVTTGALPLMRSNNRFMHNALIESVTKVYGPGQTEAMAKTLSANYNHYELVGNKILLTSQHDLELTNPSTSFSVAAPALPGTTQYQPKLLLRYHSLSGNLAQVEKPHDSPTTYLWGYNSTYLVAEIRNATYEQVKAALGVSGEVDLGTGGLSSPQETAIRTTLPQAKITTYTHKPLVGLTSQTDPAGRTTAYEYDGLGRLLRTRDEQGRILVQQQYHYARP